MRDWRARLVRGVLRGQQVVRYLLPALLRPPQQREWSRRLYDRAEGYFGAAALAAGLDGWVQERLAARPSRGQALVVGAGGGREVIPLARLGYRVAAAEQSAVLRQRALENCREAAVEADIRLGDICALPLEEQHYDLILAGALFYSVILGRERRIALLARLKQALAPGGQLLLEAILDDRPGPSRRAHRARVALAWLCGGNRRLQPRDYLSGSDELLHTFGGADEVIEEAAAAGLNAVWQQLSGAPPCALRLELRR